MDRRRGWRYVTTWAAHPRGRVRRRLDAVWPKTSQAQSTETAMFGWFRPGCPVGPKDKAWIENRMRWLAREFGLERLREAPVMLPTPEFFPDPYSGTKKAVRPIFERVCGCMKIDP